MPPAPDISPYGCISLRGVRVHNLKGIDLDLPRRKLVVFCGLSGSGKSSLAFDTLYAEGQRRYIESFSAYTRQFLERLEKPDAERIDGIPPAIAVTRQTHSQSNRSTVSTVTEIGDYLRLLYAKIARVHCRQCGRLVTAATAESVAQELLDLPEGTKYQVCCSLTVPALDDLAAFAADLQAEGFVRVIANGRTQELAAWANSFAKQPAAAADELLIVVDRLSSGTAPERVRDSVETAFAKGEGRLTLLVDSTANGERFEGDGRSWLLLRRGNQFRCETCGIDYAPLEPRLFSFNSPLGACPTCEGFGSVVDVDMDLVVPDVNKSLRDGAIAAWATPAYEHELQELLALAKDYDVPADVPYRELNERQLKVVRKGVPERKFGGLNGFFAWLERHKYKLPVRVFLSRWRSYSTCPACRGARLRPESLDARLGSLNIAELDSMPVQDCLAFLRELPLSDDERRIGKLMLDQVQGRLGYLAAVGLDYLSLDRPLRTLSGGEAQRVSLTSALGSSLVNMLYVLDEPSVGLHPHDTGRLIRVVEQLRDRGNTVVAVEHDEGMIRAADQIVEIGPGAGERGGKLVFQGTPAEMEANSTSVTGDFLAGRRGVGLPRKRRETNRGWIRLVNARGNNLQGVTAEFPLGLLCVVTGVSGSGKSTLVEDTLYPALCRRKKKDAPKPAPYDDVFGDGQIEDVLLVDQGPIGRSPRSNPVTYIKAFDDIRQVFAETLEARTHNYGPGHFSFNSADGRCPTCEGDGSLKIDMQFLADVYVPCRDCRGTRYRSEILQVKHRGLSIADVLQLTVREAFSFFRGRAKLQARLKRLLDVGLDYLRLGQAANTLSGGESQRLKLAGYLAGAKRHRTLFLLDEPTAGLHFADVAQLLDCFEALLADGHSLIVVEHNLQVIKCADYLIDLGPGAAKAGGRIIAAGSPEQVAANPASITGQYLAPLLATE